MMESPWITTVYARGMLQHTVFLAIGHTFFGYRPVTGASRTELACSDNFSTLRAIPT